MPCCSYSVLELLFIGLLLTLPFAICASFFPAYSPLSDCLSCCDYYFLFPGLFKTKTSSPCRDPCLSLPFFSSLFFSLSFHTGAIPRPPSVFSLYFLNLFILSDSSPLSLYLSLQAR
uniref:Uncharacterized protein n=1 Tax=Trypanosoma congolense (strain IL3000) TaxID=1068625 RepID=G0UU00_TRYCI|nr:hypothetical protein, unlikely [Trypanosoma congolense IL3000]